MDREKEEKDDTPKVFVDQTDNDKGENIVNLGLKR